MYNMIGREVFSDGLKRYFAKYAWKNTALPDFVGSINEAYLAKGN